MSDRDGYALALTAQNADDVFAAIAVAFAKDDVVCEPVLADWVARKKVPAEATEEAASRLARLAESIGRPDDWPAGPWEWAPGFEQPPTLEARARDPVSRMYAIHTLMDVHRAWVRLPSDMRKGVLDAFLPVPPDQREETR